MGSPTRKWTKTCDPIWTSSKSTRVIRGTQVNFTRWQDMHMHQVTPKWMLTLHVWKCVTEPELWHVAVLAAKPTTTFDHVWHIMWELAEEKANLEELKRKEETIMSLKHFSQWPRCHLVLTRLVTIGSRSLGSLWLRVMRSALSVRMRCRRRRM
jgi:hypothetical protein